MDDTAFQDSRDTWAPAQPPRVANGYVGLHSSLRLTLYRIRSDRWQGPALRIAVLADPHVCIPWVRPSQIEQIVHQTNDLDADIILLPGDFLPDGNMICRHLHADEVIPLFKPLKAPLGVHAILGNHDRGECRLNWETGGRQNSVINAFAANSMNLMLNGSLRLDHHGYPFWLVAMDTQRGNGKRMPGLHDPERAFADVPDGAPAILLAHEPDYFAEGDSRAILQISGHTHGGQFVLFGRRPMTPSKYGDRYAIGHISDGPRHLIVSAGLGYSGLPFRFGVPPEITLIELHSSMDNRGEPHVRDRNS
ncbi:MAG: metallophosphoesterase [Rhodobacteraceae bacterium]|nr:metallophosphoesterase [Paracoccaceae bacterium]